MLQVGDTIKCYDAEDMIRTIFMYDKDGEKGFWLVVERITNAK